MCKKYPEIYQRKYIFGKDAKVRNNENSNNVLFAFKENTINYQLQIFAKFSQFLSSFIAIAVFLYSIRLCIKKPISCFLAMHKIGSAKTLKLRWLLSYQIFVRPIFLSFCFWYQACLVFWSLQLRVFLSILSPVLLILPC